MKTFAALAVLAAVPAAPALAQDYRSDAAQIDSLARGTPAAPSPSRAPRQPAPRNAARPVPAMAPTLHGSPYASPSDAPGRIVMYRPAAVTGFALACPIRYQGQELVELGRGKFAEWVVPAGRYILTNNTAGVEVTVYPSETQFVRCQVKPGFMTGRADLQIVDQQSFEQHASSFQRKDIAAGNPAH